MPFHSTARAIVQLVKQEGSWLHFLELDRDDVDRGAIVRNATKRLCVNRDVETPRNTASHRSDQVYMVDFFFSHSKIHVVLEYQKRIDFSRKKEKSRFLLQLFLFGNDGWNLGGIAEDFGPLLEIAPDTLLESGLLFGVRLVLPHAQRVPGAP